MYINYKTLTINYTINYKLNFIFRIALNVISRCIVYREFYFTAPQSYQFYTIRFGSLDLEDFIRLYIEIYRGCYSSGMHLMV